MMPDQLRFQIDALAFAQLELMLYLDVHPSDEAARTQWMNNAAQLEDMERQYCALTGKFWPMRQNHHSGMREWVDDPWPWEYQY